MASGTADLQRDLGGAIMQSIFGALLTAGYASAAGAAVASSGKQRLEQRQSRADEVVLQRGRHRLALSAFGPGPDRRRRRRRPSCTATSGRTRPGSAPSCSAPRSSPSSSRSRKPSAGCSRNTRGRTLLPRPSTFHPLRVTSRADAEVAAVAVLVFVLVGLVSMPAWVSTVCRSHMHAHV